VLDWTLYSSTLEATEASISTYTTAPFCTFITERKDQYTPRKSVGAKKQKRCRIAKRNVSERKDQCHLC